MGKYVISGGPGAGKTTLLEALQQRHYRCSGEASRRVIREETARGSGCLPWIDLSCFARRVLEQMVEAYNQAAESDVTFFDRGIPDIIAYLRAGRLPVEEKYYRSLRQYPYHKTVFVAPPWPEIYVNDSERWQTFGEAVALHEIIRETYSSLGYAIVELPRAPVEERVEFVLAHL